MVLLFLQYLSQFLFQKSPETRGILKLIKFTQPTLKFEGVESPTRMLELKLRLNTNTLDIACTVSKSNPPPWISHSTQVDCVRRCSCSPSPRNCHITNHRQHIPPPPLMLPRFAALPRVEWDKSLRERRKRRPRRMQTRDQESICRLVSRMG
jgi:DNA-binding transcriptional LysR family regulator